MSDVFYLRSIDPPITPADVTEDAGGCFDMHRVSWKRSFLAADGGRTLCWHQAPDTESARHALRQLNASLEGVWPGCVIDGGDAAVSALNDVNFVAEITLPDRRAESPGAIAAALQRHDAAFVRCFVSCREPMAACVIQAPSDRAIRAALKAHPRARGSRVGVHVARVAGCRRSSPNVAAEGSLRTRMQVLAVLSSLRGGRGPRTAGVRRS